ncbi:unnamed protein product [Danaus chrysippus]|uniref:(African queen) hypothetical protein n=1 Tax=Danaus chrysippus TaxID=151541 RepID=A0A8J2W6W7_9NEOP|nr:unnamed protein product [Danaus chrysippus]
MFLKTILASSLLLLVSGEEICSCSPDKIQQDIQDFHQFLLGLPSKVEDYSLYSVLPGELSPLVPCECDKDRKKRGIGLRRTATGLRKKFKILHHMFSRNGCPIGQRRAGFICVDL